MTRRENEPPKPVGDYEVGYRRPPAQHRFQKGQSGNKRGRPKGASARRPQLLKALMEPVVIKANGRSQRVPRAEALVHVSMERALRGDVKASQILLGIMEKLGMFGKRDGDDDQIVVNIVC